MKQFQLNQNKILLIDDEDFDKVSKYHWYFTGRYVKGYLLHKKFKGQTRVAIHRMVLNAKQGQEIDHIDGNILNNQKGNLRFVSHSENMANRKILAKNNKSGYKGVYLHTRAKKWVAKIRKDNVNIYLGIFNDKKEAAKIYNINAKKYFGEFAKLNIL